MTLYFGVVESIADYETGESIDLNQALPVTIDITEELITAMGQDRAGRVIPIDACPVTEMIDVSFTHEAPTRAFLQVALSRKLTDLPAGVNIAQYDQGVPVDGTTDAEFTLTNTPLAGTVRASVTASGALVTDPVVEGGLGATSVDVVGSLVTLTGAGNGITVGVSFSYEVAPTTERAFIIGGNPEAQQLGFFRLRARLVGCDGSENITFQANRMRVSATWNIQGGNQAVSSAVATAKALADANGNLGFLIYDS